MVAGKLPALTNWTKHVPPFNLWHQANELEHEIEHCMLAVASSIKASKLEHVQVCLVVRRLKTCASRSLLKFLLLLWYTANLCNQSATVVRLIGAINATFSFCNFWLQSLQLIGCKVNVHLLDANVGSITCCT